MLYSQGLAEDLVHIIRSGYYVPETVNDPVRYCIRSAKNTGSYKIL